MAEIYFDVDTALSEVPVNIFPLTDDTDFKTIETGIVYNQSGMDLVWNFVTTAGAFTQTAITPTTSGVYDWTNQGKGMYTIELPASGGASINNDTKGFGWFTGVCTGVLPWRSPIFCFRASGLNDKLIDDAYSTTRGLAGTALPAAAADAAGGLPISDAGGLDLDAKLANTNEITATRMGYIDAAISSRSNHSAADVWTVTTRTLSSFGTLVSDIATAVWSATTRTLSAFGFSVTASSVTDKTGYSLSVTPPTAAQIRSEIDSNSTQLAAIIANIAALNNISTSQVLAQVASALTSYDPPTKAELDNAVSPLSTSVEVDALGEYIDTEVAAIKTVTDKLNGMLQVDGSVNQFTANALELAPSGGGGGGDATAANQLIIMGDIAALQAHGDANWLTPSGIGGTIAITFNIKDDSGHNILDAVVEVWDTAGTTLKERKETNSSGNAIFNCKAETYTIKITKSGYTFANASYTVTAPATVNYVMTAFVIPVSPTLGDCRVWMRLVNTYTSLTVTAEVPEYLAGNNLVMGNYTGVYDTINNLVYWDLPIGAVNSVLRITELGFEVVVPLILDEVSSELVDLI